MEYSLNTYNLKNSAFRRRKMSMPLPVKVTSKLIKEVIDSKRDFMATDGATALTATSIHDDIAVRHSRVDFDGNSLQSDVPNHGVNLGLLKKPATTGASLDLKASVQQKAEYLASRYSVENEEVMVNEFKGLVSLIIEKSRNRQIGLVPSLGFTNSDPQPYQASSIHRFDTVVEGSGLIKRPPEPKSLFVGEPDSEIIVPMKNFQRSSTHPSAIADGGLVVPRVVNSSAQKGALPVNRNDLISPDDHIIVVAAADRSRLNKTVSNPGTVDTNLQIGAGNQKSTMGIVNGLDLDSESISVPIPSNHVSNATTIFVPAFRKA